MLMNKEGKWTWTEKKLYYSQRPHIYLITQLIDEQLLKLDNVRDFWSKWWNEIDKFISFFPRGALIMVIACTNIIFKCEKHHLWFNADLCSGI